MPRRHNYRGTWGEFPRSILVPPREVRRTVINWADEIEVAESNKPAVIPDHGWTHPMCDVCYFARYPEWKPIRMREPDMEWCCWCNDLTDSGIYMRADPAEVQCVYDTPH